MQLTTSGSATPSAASPSHNMSSEDVVVDLNKIPKLRKHNSIDSAHTNTISNSSLQEVDAEEFDSTELANYMGVVNNEINALQSSSCSIFPVPSCSSNSNEADENPP